MLTLFAKLPITEDERVWVDEGFRRLDTLLGSHRHLQSKVVLPRDEDFPDPYRNSPAAAERLFHRICTYMLVDSSSIDFEVFQDDAAEMRDLLPISGHSKSRFPAGLYIPGSSDSDPAYPEQPLQHPKILAARPVIAVLSSKLRDPLVLIATIAHEIGHIILLRDVRLDPETPDHEPLTDLLTIYLGFGVFTANSALQFRQFQNETKQGWSTSRLGYLSQEILGYALARSAVIRGEEKPQWSRHLSTNVRTYFTRSAAWLRKNHREP